MSIVNFYFKNALNVGDRASAPGLYLSEHAPSITLADISERDQHKPSAVILGGGAMVPKVNKQMLWFGAPTVLWGVGHTIPGAMRYVSYRISQKYDLIGVRDANSVYRWVPCASCLSPLFDQDYEVTRDYVVYQNTKDAPLPNADLGNDCLDMAHVIKTLASANTVITSSYYGAYWATLLKRRVVVIPFGSKFFGLKHVPTIATWETRFQQRGRKYLSALIECREANLAFARTAQSVLETVAV